MNLLAICQAVADLVGIPRPSAVVGSTEADARQLLQLANEEGRHLSDRYPWQALIREASFTTAATESQGTLTTIIGASETFSYILNDTIWNRTRSLPIYGPNSPQRWQADKALAMTGPFDQYRIRGGALRMNPVPTAGHSCYFEYVTRNWCTDSTGATSAPAWAADTDIPILPDYLFIQGLEWRWKQTKGLEYSQDFVDYERLVADAIARDGGKQTAFLGGGGDNYSPGIFVSRGSWDL